MIGQPNVSTEAILFQPNNIGERAVFGIGDSTTGMEPPAEANPAFQIEHGRIVLNGRWHNQGSQDNPRLSPIDHVLQIIA